MQLPSDPIAHFATERPQGVAVHFEGRALTWRELDERTARACGFIESECPRGGIVVIQGLNHPDFIALREAIFRTGRTFAAVSPTATEEELVHVLRLTNAYLFLRSPQMAPTPVPHLNWGDAFAGRPVRVDDRRGEAKSLLLTSGTTGLPKACVRPVAADEVRMNSMVASFGLHPNQSHLVATPLYHSGPAIFQRTHLALGSELHLAARFEPAAIWAAAAAGHAATAFFVPTHYHRLLRHDTGAPADRVATWWIAGAPASPALKAAVIARLGEGKLWEFLGASETGTVAVMPPADHLRKPGSVGKPPPGVEVRILDDAGRSMPTSETGLIYVKSAMLMAGYHGSDAPHAMWRDGFLSVGDLGRLDDDGYLYLSDRRTDLIITGGVNVYPAEVEAALLAFAGVDAAAVVGEADEEWGQRVVAVIAGGADVDKLTDFLCERLSPAKRPKRIEVWPELPHNAIGKPLRAEVRAAIAARR